MPLAGFGETLKTDSATGECMKPPEEQNPEPANHKPAAPTPASNNDGGCVNPCVVENSADTSRPQTSKSFAGADEEIARSLARVDALPKRFSRSRLMPFTAYLLKLKEKGYSYRLIVGELLKDHGVVAEPSTVFRFMKKAMREARHARKALAAKKDVSFVEQAPVGNAATLSPAYIPSRLKPTGPSKAREAIRVIIAQAEAAKQLDQSNKAPSPRFDPRKPLLRSKQTPKPN